jgi:hypothetical protein
VNQHTSLGRFVRRVRHTFAWTDHKDDGIRTSYWRRHVERGRLKFGVTVMRHRYPLGSSDRWVVHPSLVYDRKERS